MERSLMVGAEDRAKVAAAAASVIPFSCIICFDEFDSIERPPMILPCGHTFVCLPCTKRLKKCMECRQPLFLPAQAVKASKVPHPPHLPPHGTSHYHHHHSRGLGHRYGAMDAPLTPPTKHMPQQSSSEPTPLPIPKNLVLLSMMEASERQARINNEMSASREEDEDEEAFDLNKIITGMATLSGPCGTYAVREKGGLVVVHADPRKSIQGEIEESAEGGKDEKKEEEDQEESSQPSIPLEYGQTVQVVSFEDGVAKLARGLGYILANSSQLVKVGDALDESCRLEGLLNTVLSRGKDLQKTLDDNRQIESGLQRQLEVAMEAEPNHPIISHLAKQHSEDHPTVQIKVPESASLEHTQTDAHSPTQHLLQTPERSVTEVFHTPQQRSVIDADDGASMVAADTTPTSPKSPNSIDNSDIGIGPYMPHYREVASQDSRIVDFGCGSVLLEEGAELFGENVAASSEASVRSTGTGTRDRRPATDIGNRGRSASIEHQRQAANLHPAPTLTASFDNIDFRTGLSGHRALTSAHLHSSPKPMQRHIRMMGEHRGLGRNTQHR